MRIEYKIIYNFYFECKYDVFIIKTQINYLYLILIPDVNIFVYIANLVDLKIKISSQILLGHPGQFMTLSNHFIEANI